MLTLDALPRVQRAISDAGLDGWLLYDFRSTNPIAAGLLGMEGLVTRRVFAFVPRAGTPVAVTHAIEQGAWRHWPEEWRREVYSSWRELERIITTLVSGRRIAMEYSPGDAVPYLDRIPAGVLEMVRTAGADVVSSGELVSRFYATWTEDDLASHRRAAEHVAEVARAAMAYAGAEASAGRPVSEHALQQRISASFARLGLLADHPPIVAVGANAANPHYEPTPAGSSLIQRGDVLLIDLWAREPDGVYADQTWMASLGPPTERALTIWTTIRDARDAALTLLRERVSSGMAVRGGEVDDASRALITGRGFGPNFTHRTGHSIDSRDLHGSGPHIDNLETREERLLIPGVAFSIEPGVYVRGEIGMRTEVNAYVGDREVVVTPKEYQDDIAVV